MIEFGCDKWRLDDINYEGAVFRCPKVDTNAGLGLCRNVTSFDAAERVRIAKEELDCAHCEFNTAKQGRVLGRTAIKGKNPYEPSQTVDLGSREVPIAKRYPNSHPYDASGRPITG